MYKNILAVAVLTATVLSSAFGFIPYVQSDWTEAAIQPGIKDWLVLPVEFKEDSDNFTSGRGKFLSTWLDVDETDTLYTVDPVPHNSTYFLARLKSIDHYWNTVTKGAYQVDTDISQLLSVVTVEEDIRYYNPATQTDSIDFRLAEFVYDAVKASEESGNFPDYQEELIIYHAGVGQDFDFSNMYDSTPFDLPSFYFDSKFLSENLSSEEYQFLSDLGIKRGIVLPEMQNQLGINIGLHGTEILLTGFLIGLPALYNTETGTSGVGVFGLMDQGSNNAAGLVPITPSAFERILLGIETPEILDIAGTTKILKNRSYKIPINSSEYFLIEYRKNAGAYLDSLFVEKEFKTQFETLEFLEDSLVSFSLVVDDASGVLVGVSDYDVSLPGNGLLIWQIVDPFEQHNEFSDNPNGGIIPMIDFVEADGGDDIGKNYGILSGNVNQGWKYDMWFSDNPGYFHNNPDMDELTFSDNSHPNTRSFANISSGIQIDNFIFSSDSVSFNLTLNDDIQNQLDKTFLYCSVEQSEKSIYYGFRDEWIVAFSDDSITQVYDNSEIINPENHSLYAYKDSVLFFQSEMNIIKFTIGDGGVLTLVDEDNFSQTVNPKKSVITSDYFYCFSKSNNSVIYSYNMNDGNLIDINFNNFQAELTVSTLIYDDDLFMTNAGNLYKTSSSEPYDSFDFTISAISGINDTILLADEAGGLYYYDILSGNLSEKQASQMQFKHIIPVHLNDDGLFEIAALGLYDDLPVLATFTHYGYLLNAFPIFYDYSDLRIARENNEVIFLASDKAGRLDEINSKGYIQSVKSIPVNYQSFFLNKTARGDIQIISNGTIWKTDFEDIFWGYPMLDNRGSNYYVDIRQNTTQSGEKLINKGLIYNYPNPIENGRTSFRYFANEASSVTISIFELSGRHIKTLKQNPEQMQWNEISWNVKGLASGVYIAKIVVEGNGKKEEYIIKPAILN